MLARQTLIFRGRQKQVELLIMVFNIGPLGINVLLLRTHKKCLLFVLQQVAAKCLLVGLLNGIRNLRIGANGSLS